MIQEVIFLLQFSRAISTIKHIYVERKEENHKTKYHG